MRSWLVVLAVTGATLSGACRRGPPPRITLQDVERCERGVDDAALAPSFQEATALFHRECSYTFVEPPCRQAFFDAAAFAPERQVTMVLSACAKAYCPFFSEQKLAACDPSFVTTPLSAAFAWPQLHEAILWRDASGYALRVQRAFQTHNLTVAERAPPPVAAPPAPASTAAP